MDLIFAQAQTTEGSGFTSLLFLAAMIGFFWFLFIRPQRKRMREQQELQSALGVGDQVQTIGGLVGTVRAIDDDTVVLDLESGQVRVLRRAIAARVGDGS